MKSAPDPIAPLPNDYARELSDEEVTAGMHREFVGQLWEEIGRSTEAVGFRPDGSLTVVTEPARDHRTPEEPDEYASAPGRVDRP